MRTSPVRSSWLSAALCLCLCAWSATWGADERPPTRVEVEEWSIWVGNPAQATVNATRVYRNTMPGNVGTSRPKFEDEELAGKFPIAPISVVQFFGEPEKDVDVELRAKKGTFLAHWPPGTDRGGRLQWFKSDLIADPPAGIPQGYLPESHWFQKLRGTGSALFLKNASRFERFLAYDTELTLPIPLKIRGGPDEYTLQNLTGRRLLDVAVIAPTENGYRVGWLDELPSAAPEEDAAAKKKKDEDEKAAKKKTAPEKAEAVFQEAEATDEGGGREDPAAAGRGGRERPREHGPGAQPDRHRGRREGARQGGPRPDRGPGPAPLRAGRPHDRQGGGRPGRADDPEGGRDRGPRCARGGAGEPRAELSRHRDRHALHHHGRPARRGRREEGGRDRRASDQAHPLATAETLQPVLPRAHPRRLHATAGGAGPPRGHRRSPSSRNTDGRSSSRES